MQQSCSLSSPTPTLVSLLRSVLLASAFAMAALAGVIPASGSPLCAQPAIESGARVRVWLTEEGRRLHPAIVAPSQIGVVSSRSPLALELAIPPDGTRLSFAFSEIERIERSHGRPSHRLRGAVIGGAITSVLFVSSVCAFSDGSCDIGSHFGGFLAYAATGAVPGAIIGAKIGSRSHEEERWENAWPIR